ncbi:MAG TPA: T9SS type A sorting domain-containing protein [Ignavibacteriales bacterium]|nr:T9SS type A sorting domain-containing protein [Ignavibacteriales bacterium]
MEIQNKIDLEVSGNWINKGNFAPGRSSITLTGSSPQTISAPQDALFHNLEIKNKSALVRLKGNLSLTGDLALNSARLNTDFYTLSLSPASRLTRTSGYIIGTLKKGFSNSAQKIFEIGTETGGYAPVTIKAHEGTGTITVKEFQGTHPNAIGKMNLKRYWTIDSDGISKVDLTFQYQPEDVVGNEKDYSLGTFTGRWTFPKSKLNPQKHLVSLIGVTNFSADWTLGKVPPLPVDLSSFTTNAASNHVTILWETQTEINSSRFEVERSALFNETSRNFNWQKVGEVPAFGYCSSQQEYSYIDQGLNPGFYAYRLRMIGNDGIEKYSEPVTVEITRPVVAELGQNYPNPFNSSTAINYTIPEDAQVTLSIFNIQGQLIAQPVNEYKPAGRYTLNFDASSLASGTYIYKLQAGSFTQIKKMLLLK